MSRSGAGHSPKERRYRRPKSSKPFFLQSPRSPPHRKRAPFRAQCHPLRFRPSGKIAVFRSVFSSPHPYIVRISTDIYKLLFFILRNYTDDPMGCLLEHRRYEFRQIEEYVITSQDLVVILGDHTGLTLFRRVRGVFRWKTHF